MGPIPVVKKVNYKIKLESKVRLSTDYYRPLHKSKAPLLIFSHGNKSFKEAHSHQASIAATWGFHVLVLQLPNRDKWTANGKTIYDLTRMIHVWPKVLSDKIDTDKIILVGHSFGGSAISIATGMGAPVAGLIYLDPAIVSEGVKGYLKQIEAPAVLLGADPKVFKSKKRSHFYKNKPGNMLEVTFKDATHDDAQYPSRFQLKAFGFDPFTDEEKQKKFTAAIVASAFSFANFGNVDFAYKAFKPDVAAGNIINPRIKR
jgi:pimeloyl-ACP methyl ester carboxylesterase